MTTTSQTPHVLLEHCAEGNKMVSPSRENGDLKQSPLLRKGDKVFVCATLPPNSRFSTVHLASGVMEEV